MTHVCCICGRPLPAVRWCVNFDNRTNRPLPPDVRTEESGALPIGPECRRKLADPRWALPWSPTGRRPSNPPLQNMAPGTAEGREIVKRFHAPMTVAPGYEWVRKQFTDPDLQRLKRDFARSAKVED